MVFEWAMIPLDVFSNDLYGPSIDYNKNKEGGVALDEC
jgi:hypothetical protein